MWSQSCNHVRGWSVVVVVVVVGVGVGVGVVGVSVGVVLGATLVKFARNSMSMPPPTVGVWVCGCVGVRPAPPHRTPPRPHTPHPAPRTAV